MLGVWGQGVQHHLQACQSHVLTLLYVLSFLRPHLRLRIAYRASVSVGQLRYGRSYEIHLAIATVDKLQYTLECGELKKQVRHIHGCKRCCCEQAMYKNIYLYKKGSMSCVYLPVEDGVAR